VTLTASSAGGSDSTSQTIVVIDPPIASFTQQVTELTVRFTDTSTNSPTSWQWDMGDGTILTGQNPEHTYAPGAYVVTLVASNAAGSSAPVMSTINVASLPVADFVFSTTGLQADFTDMSSNLPTGWFWDFGDDMSAGNQNPSHSYSAPGTFIVTLTASNAAGQSVPPRSRQVTVDHAPPIANFDCTVVGGGVSCDGSISSNEVSYAWVAPDAVQPITGASTAMPTFTFLNSGTFPITLTVANVSGATDPITKNVTVTVPQPPGQPVIMLDSNVNGTVTVSATASNSPTGWSWSAPPDGSPATGSSQSFTTTYSSDGLKTIGVVAMNAVGSSPTAFIDVPVNVSLPPVVISVNQTGIGPSVTVSGMATNSPTSWNWSLPGASPSTATGQNPTFNFTLNDTYNGTVTATNADGTSPMFSFAVVVTGIVPTVTGVTPPNSGGTVTLTGVATNSPTSWNWSMPGMLVSGGGTATPTFTFATAGLKSGTVTATNANGDSVAFPVNLTVIGPTAAFTWSNVGLTADFMNNSTPATGADYLWEFGDGATSTLPNPSRTYELAGTYTTTLTVTVGSLSHSFDDVVMVP